MNRDGAMTDRPVVYVADAGSVARGNFHWVSSLTLGESSQDPEALAHRIVRSLSRSKTVALGFESPLFMPCPDERERLGKARRGECSMETGNRPFNASAGATVLVTGIQTLAWVLRKVQQAVPDTVGTTRWAEFQSKKADLLVWEAFVSGKEKAQDHVGDARLAVEAFLHHWAKGDLESASCVSESHVFSLAGAAILFASLSTDQSLLREPSIVLRPVATAR